MTPTLLGQGIDEGGDDVKHLPQNDQKSQMKEITVS